MNQIIREQAEYLGFDACDMDIEEIKTRYFHNLHRNGQVWIQGVRSAIRAYFD